MSSLLFVQDMDTPGQIIFRGNNKERSKLCLEFRTCLWGAGGSPPPFPVKCVFVKNDLTLHYFFKYVLSGSRSPPRGYEIPREKSEGLVDGEQWGGGWGIPPFPMKCFFENDLQLHYLFKHVLSGGRSPPRAYTIHPEIIPISP